MSTSFARGWIRFFPEGLGGERSGLRTKSLDVQGCFCAVFIPGPPLGVSVLKGDPGRGT